MRFHVVVLPLAARDVDRILGWLHSRSAEGAATWYRRWLVALDTLESAADGCSLAPESSDHDALILQLQFKTRRGHPYRILFTLRGSTAYILHVRGWGQNLLRPDELRSPPD